MSSTSMPSIVNRLANSSGDQSKSTYFLSQLRVSFTVKSTQSMESEETGPSKLPQKSHVVLIKQPDIVDAISNHGDALDAEAEGPTGPDLRVVPHILEHLGMDHAAAGDFQPFLPHLSGKRAAEVDFETRFGITEVMRTEADVRFRAHQFLKYKFNGALQISSRNLAINIQTFDLLERWVVGGVCIIPSINPARNDDPDRRLLFLHHPD